MNIIVAAGGLSPERDVSLASGQLIAKALIAKGNNAVMIDISSDIEDKDLIDFFKRNVTMQTSYAISEHAPIFEDGTDNRKHAIGKNVLEVCKLADIVFIALHGDIGENGKFQALLDIYGVKYTGTNSLGSAIAMDKDISKQLLKNNGILTPKWAYLDLEQEYDSSINLEQLADWQLQFPVVVKPVSCGSSIGVSIVHDSAELQTALNAARLYEDCVMLEQYVQGREMTVGILNHMALPIIEIKPRNGFFDYKNKYQPGLTDEICPADVNEELKCELQDLALKVHKILRLGSYSRIDFIISESKDVYCLEANTLPGMTHASLLPKAAKAHGLTYEDLCEQILKI